MSFPDLLHTTLSGYSIRVGLVSFPDLHVHVLHTTLIGYSIMSWASLVPRPTLCTSHNTDWLQYQSWASVIPRPTCTSHNTDWLQYHELG